MSRYRETIAVAREERVAMMKERLRGLIVCDVLIVGTRYGGSYEGAPWVAWIGDPDWLDDYQNDDVACREFWHDYKDAPKGLGKTPDEALADLVKQAR